jgi:hypothetical protein
VAFLKFDEIFDLSSTFTTHVSRSCIVGNGVTGSVKLSAFNPGTLKVIGEIEKTEVGPAPAIGKPSTNSIFPTSPLLITVRPGPPTRPAFYESFKYATTLNDLQNTISASIYGTSPLTDFSAVNSDGNPDIRGNLLQDVKNQPNLPRDSKYFCVTRYEPEWEVTSSEIGTSGFRYNLAIPDTGSSKKNIIRTNLYEKYRGTYRQCHWAYTNYNTINFFTSSTTRDDAVLMYPSPTSSVDSSARYRPDGPFTFEFWVNPRYTVDSETSEFNAGTILHYSSTYAISLISGSSKDVNGLVDGYRLMLQLSSSADTNPSQVDVDSLPSLVFLSSDNSLSKNNWHHVALRWGGEKFNMHTGSFVIDGSVDSEFVIPSASITYQSPATTYQGYGGSKSDADVLFIGNYYDGNNTGADAVRKFFNTTVGTNEGLEVIDSTAGNDPVSYSFTNKLNAELHEIRFYKSFRDLLTINSEMSTGLGGNSLEVTSSEGLSLYIPPFFVKESPRRRSLSPNISNNTGFGVNHTETPFNVTASFGSAALDINVENFVRDFANGTYPRLLNMTASGDDIPGNTDKAKQQLMASAKSNTKNFLLLPNDNGQFTPQYYLLNSGTLNPVPVTGSSNDRFVNDYGILDFSLVSLNNMLNRRESFFGSEFKAPVQTVDGVDGAVFSSELEAIPEWESSISLNAAGTAPVNSPAYPLNGSRLPYRGYMFELYGDESSNEVVIFNVPQIMYGNKIEPKTMILTDSGLTGSGGKVSITIRDDGFGSLYRADAITVHAENSSIGNIFYEEGHVVIKTPHLPYFGSSSFGISFKGTQNTHVREIIAQAPKNLLNSSSNPTFVKLKPSDNPNEVADEFVYITSIQLHDENLNVIGRANLSQPLKKRPTDEFAFRLKLDY